MGAPTRLSWARRNLGLDESASLGFPLRPTLPILVLSTGCDGLREVTVPLSEHEQRLLEQMERALYAEDPKFATSMRNTNPLAGDKRRIALGVVAILAGMGLLLAGVATKLVIVGLIGFLAMLGGLWLGLVALKPTAPAAKGAPTNGQPGRITRVGPSPRPKRSRGGETLSEKMERRWRRRRETGDF